MYWKGTAMDRQQYTISIDAPREKVWDVLWNDATYPVWTAPFSPGSRAETDWQKGSKTLFINDDRDGMVSTIAENIPNEFMSIKHLGVVHKGVEDTESEKAREWAGGLENYTLKTVNGQTELVVDMTTENEIPQEYKDFFLDTWPKALDKVKELAEKK